MMYVILWNLDSICLFGGILVVDTYLNAYAFQIWTEFEHSFGSVDSDNIHLAYIPYIPNFAEKFILYAWRVFAG